jgi:hypothetical protein
MIFQKRKFLLFSLAFLVYTFKMINGQGYEIKIKINGLQNTNVIVGHYINKPIFPDDTIHLNSNGEGFIKSKKILPQGLYVFFLPSSKYFDFIIGKDQQFSIIVDTLDLINSLKFEGSAENEIFCDFQKYMVAKKEELKKLQDIIKTSQNLKDKENAKKKIESLGIESKDKILKISKEHPELFVSTFLLSTLDIEVPEAPKDKNGKIDSTWQYRYFRSHFFDNFNISDARLLRTPLYEDKIIYYIDNVVPQIPDTINKEVDFLINKTKADSSLFKFMLITLFNHFGKSNIMGMDGVQVHIADKYYITEAWWSDKKFIDDLKERISILKPLLLNQIAPDIQLLYVPSDHFKAAVNDTALKRYPHAGNLFYINKVEADFTVLIFWEATCSHCKKSVPEMYKIFKDTLEGMNIKIIAVSTLFGEDGKEKWVDFVNQHQLYDWINAWNPYDYKFKEIYDVRSTPQIFVLNRKKEIIGKRIGPEDVTGLIIAYKKQFSNR